MIKKKFQGHLLAAHPSNPDDELSKSVILLVACAGNTSIGLQINSPVKDFTLQDVADRLGLWWDDDDMVWYGGAEGTHKIHVIHSSDWSGFTTIRINDEISVTNDISVLTAIMSGEGPECFRACAGYWTWPTNTLDAQINATAASKVTHRWEAVDATIENIFDHGGYEQWVNTLEDATWEQIDKLF